MADVQMNKITKSKLTMKDPKKVVSTSNLVPHMKGAPKEMIPTAKEIKEAAIKKIWGDNKKAENQKKIEENYKKVEARKKKSAKKNK